MLLLYVLTWGYLDEKKEKHFTVSALIIEKNKVLLIKHKKLNVWLYPGGHIENHETPDEALIREVKEETGLDVEIIGDKDLNLEVPTMEKSLHHDIFLLMLLNLSIHLI